MRKTGAMKLHRLLACVLSLVMLLTALPAYARELAGWEGIDVSVIYTDRSGQTYQVPAVQIPEDTGISHGWWVTLPQDALDSAVQLQILHPDPAYSYWTFDWTLNLNWFQDKNAADLDDMYAYYVGYSYNGAVQVSQTQDCMKVYLSTMEPPFAYTPGAEHGAEMIVPGGDEGFGSAPGAELITPGTQEPAEAVVTVYYKHVDGRTLDVQDVTLPEGVHTLWPESAKVSGLNLAGEYSHTVTVYAGGYSDVPSITFLYEDAYVAPAEATVEVYYVHENGSMLDQQTVILQEGTHAVYPQSSHVDGYELISDGAVYVTVSADGWTDTASVTFYYRDVYVAPVEAVVTVSYYHENGTLLDSQQVTLAEGTHTLWPQSSRVSGLELAGEATAMVTVYPDGSVSAPEVTFLYWDPYVAPATGELTVMYVLENGTVIDNQVIPLAQGEQTVFPESRKVSGLTLVSDASVSVYVDGGGAVSPNPVQFVYREAVQQVAQATVTVFIFDTMGNEIAPRQQVTLSEGSHIIEAPAGNAIPGYELISEAVLSVTVHADGSYTPAGDEMSFWYRPVQEDNVESIVPVAPVVTEAPSSQSATVTLRYLDSRGYAIADEQTALLHDGSNTLTPDYAHVPAGYTVISGTEVQTVTVRNGRANVTSVTFYFEKTQTVTQAPSAYDVTVYYYDTLGNEIAPRQTLRLAPGTHWVQAKPQNLPAGYELASESAFQLTVYADGSMDRAAQDVGFWYAKQQVQPKTALITVRYVDGSGRTIAGPFTQELTGGQSYLISPEAGAVPEAYDVSAAEPVTVSVSAEGYASPAVVSFVAELRRDTQQIPVGVELRRYGVVNASNVALRSEPYTTRASTVMQRVNKGGMVYMLATEYNESGELWTQVIVDGRTGWMKAEFIDALTPQASDVYAASVGATPVPTFTPAPTPTPTEGFVEYITPVPVTPAPYAGYAVLSYSTSLRTGTGSNDMTLAWLGSNELVLVSENVQNPYTGESWSLVRTMNGLTGYLPTAGLRPVSEQEAAWYIQQYYTTPAPTTLVTNTPEPVQQQGLALTIVNNVPLRRMASEQSSIVRALPYNTVVYITGQTYADGQMWHNVAADGESGYIRGDLLRMMTDDEETDYMLGLSTPVPAITPTYTPFDDSSLSSFGYVTRNNVNFRADATTSSQKLGTLHRYAMATVLGSERVNGVTWYLINYNGVTGYVHGDYFHQMTLREFSEFYGSDLYRQGVSNNTAQSGSSNNSGSSSGQISQEDQAVDDWYASGSVIQPSYEPFLPVGTVQPIATATPTLEPLPGYVTQGTIRPTATPTPATGFGQVGNSSGDMTAPGATGSVTYPMKESGGGSWLIWVVVIVLLALAVGGAVAVMQHQRRRQQIALKAAQRRAQQARSAGGGRPYAARPGTQQTRTGAYPSYGQPQQPPIFPQSAQQGTGYTSQFPQQYPAQPQQSASATPVQPAGPAAPEQPARPYARTAEDNANGDSRRVGRRTAWQQAHAQQNLQDGKSADGE